MLHILQTYFTESIHNDEQIIRFIESIQIVFTELTDETNYLYTKTQEIPFINDLLEHIKTSIYFSSSSSLLKPVLPSLNKIPSVLYGFLDAKLLSYLYNFATQELSIKKLADIEGIQCPIDNQSEDKISLIQSFEILLHLCFQALHDQQYSSNSFLLKHSLNYQSNLTLLIRILDEKIYFYLEELSLPDPISYEYLNKFFSHLCSQSDFNIRQNDFELVTHLFSESFRIYRRDIRLCQQLFIFFRLFIKNFYKKIRDQFFSNDNWLHIKKILDAFWQMTIHKNILLNNSTRKLIIEIKRILNQDEEINLDDIQLILNDSSYFVRLEAIQLCLNLFYENKNLKSSDEQNKICQNLIENNSLSILLFCYLANTSEYISRQIAFHLIQLGIEKKLSGNIIKHILPKNVPIQAIIQYYHQQLSYEIKDFPWEFFNMNSMEQYNSFIFSTYFLSMGKDRQQVNAMFSDIKSSLIEYFPEIQAYLLPLLANRTKENIRAEEHRQMIEKLITKTEYNRLMKQKLTMIILRLLLTYWNNKENQFYDQWAPQPIIPAYTWSILKNTFEYIKQIMNAKIFIELLIKSAVRKI
jgi:hypothetical protein